MLLKGFSVFKNKLQTLGKEVPKLFIVGDGDELDKLKMIISELALEDNVELIGARNDINVILSESDVYILPSLEEGLSISLIEALSSGIPIIATNVGGNPDVIQDYKTGLLFESGNFNDLSEKIFEYTIDYNLRKDISINCIKKSDEFDIKTCEKKYLNMYLKERNSIL